MSACLKVSETTPSRAARLAIAGLVFAIGVGIDQWTKQWAFTQLRGQPAKILIPDRLAFDFAFNPGSAFGMFASQPGARAGFIVITVLALLYLGALIYELPGRPSSRRAAWAATIALSSMAAGAMGNLIDRLTRVYDTRVRLGDELQFWLLVDHPVELSESMLRGRNFVDIPRHGVVDFIAVTYWQGRQWPSFNIADSLLVVGVGLFLIYLGFQGGLREPPPESQEQP